MRKMLNKWLVAVLGLALVGLSVAPAESWNFRYGMGNKTDEYSFTGYGAPMAVIGSVHSNAVYYITSANASGQPVFRGVWAKSDNAAGTLDFYVGADSYTLTNSGTAGTNVLAISSTNGLAPYDVLVVRNRATDTYQLAVNSNAVAFALVTYNGLTNGYASGDTVYRMAKVSSMAPFSMHALTNQVKLPAADYIPLALPAQRYEFNGRVGVPAALVQTYTTAGGLYVTGDYYVRPERP